MNTVVLIAISAIGGVIVGAVVTFLVARNNPNQTQAAIDAANQLGKKL